MLSNILGFVLPLDHTGVSDVDCPGAERKTSAEFISTDVGVSIEFESNCDSKLALSTLLREALSFGKGLFRISMNVCEALRIPSTPRSDEAAEGLEFTWTGSNVAVTVSKTLGWKVLEAIEL